MRPGREWVRLQPLMHQHQHSLLVLGTGVSPNFALQNQSRIAIAWDITKDYLYTYIEESKKKQKFEFC